MYVHMNMCVYIYIYFFLLMLTINPVETKCLSTENLNSTVHKFKISSNLSCKFHIWHGVSAHLHCGMWLS